MYTYSGVLIIAVTMTVWLIYAISCPNRVMHNGIIDYISGISMEIYLSHMMSFIAVQFLNVSNYIHNIHMVYLLTCILTLVVAICFSHVVKYIFLPKVFSFYDKFKAVEIKPNELYLKRHKNL